MSKTYQDTHEGMLAAVALAKRPQGPSPKLAAFWPQRGADYDAGPKLLVIGRAVNGWEPVFDLETLRESADSQRRITEDARKYCEKDWPIDWVIEQEGGADYNTRRSARRTARW